MFVHIFDQTLQVFQFGLVLCHSHDYGPDVDCCSVERELGRLGHLLQVNLAMIRVSNIVQLALVAAACSLATAKHLRDLLSVQLGSGRENKDFGIGLELQVGANFELRMQVNYPKFLVCNGFLHHFELVHSFDGVCLDFLDFG